MPVVDVGKQQLDSEGALTTAAKLKDALSHLLSFLRDAKDTPNVFNIDNALSSAEKCSNYQQVIVCMSQPEQEAHGGLKADLEGIAGQIKAFLTENEWGAKLDFNDTLHGLFAWNDVRGKLDEAVLLSMKLALVQGAGLWVGKRKSGQSWP